MVRAVFGKQATAMSCRFESCPIRQYFFGVSKMNKLTPLQIKQRIVLFNQTHDFSVFGDVPDDQSYAVMYPEILDLEK